MCVTDSDRPGFVIPFTSSPCSFRRSRHTDGEEVTPPSLPLGDGIKAFLNLICTVRVLMVSYGTGGKFLTGDIPSALIVLAVQRFSSMV